MWLDFFSSRSLDYQFQSTSLRNNEEFDNLYKCAKAETRFESRRHFEFQCPPPRLVDVVSKSFFALSLDTIKQNRAFNLGEWEIFQDTIRNADKMMKRAENAGLSKLLAGIILQLGLRLFQIFPTLTRNFRAVHLLSHFFPNYWEGTHRRPDPESLLEDLLESFAESVSSELGSARKLVMSALALLSFMYRYLIGCVDKVGGKTYSPGSFLFRLIFVAVVLFLGSYVWIKFRQASFTANRRKRKLGDEAEVQAGRVYRRAVKDARGEVKDYKYEPRFKPLREKTESGTPLTFNCLSLGSYNTRCEAEIVRHIAVVLYGEEEGRPVQFEDGLRLPFPSVTERENCPSSGKKKADWVTQKTKKLYAELLREKARQLQLLHPAVETTGSHHGHGGEASGSDPSLSAPVAPSTAIELTCFTPPHGGNGVLEQATTSESQGVGQEAPLAREEFSASFLDCDFEQFISSMLQFEENDFPAMDQIEGDHSDMGRIGSFKSTPVPPQSSALDIPATAIVASLPQLGSADQGLEFIELPHLNSATAITFQQLESLPELVPVQQHVTCQEKRPEKFPGSNVELQRKLLESEERNLELEQKLHQSEVVEQPTTSAPHGLGQEPPLTRGVFSASVSDCDFEQFISSMLQFEENDFPAMDKVEGDHSDTGRICSFKSTPVPPQSSALDIPPTAIVASLPQLGGADQGLEVIELPHLNSATAITFPQLESLSEQGQLQQRGTCQETRPEEFPGSNVELQQKVQFEERISELVQKLRQSEVENEKWRSMFRELAKLI